MGETVIVAVILVVFISITTSALLMLYMFNEINKVKTQTPSEKMGSVIIEEIELASDTEIKLVIKNIGSNDVVIDSLFLYDSEHNYVGTMYPTFGPVTIAPRQSKEVDFTPNEPITRSYQIIEVRGKGFSVATAVKTSGK